MAIFCPLPRRDGLTYGVPEGAVKRDDDKTQPSAPPAEGESESAAPTDPGGLPLEAQLAASYTSPPVIQDRKSDSMDEWFDALVRKPYVAPHEQAARDDLALADDPHAEFPSERGLRAASSRPASTDSRDRETEPGIASAKATVWHSRKGRWGAGAAIVAFGVGLAVGAALLLDRRPGEPTAPATSGAGVAIVERVPSPIPPGDENGRSRGTEDRAPQLPVPSIASPNAMSTRTVSRSSSRGPDARRSAEPVSAPANGARTEHVSSATSTALPELPAPPPDMNVLK